MELLQHTERIGAMVNQSSPHLGVAEDQPFPGPGHQTGHHLVSFDLFAPQQLSEPAHCFEHRLTTLHCPEPNDFGQQGNKRPHRGIALHQFNTPDFIGMLVCWWGQLHHRRERSRDLTPRHHSFDFGPDLLDRDCIAGFGCREQDLNSRR